MNRILILFSISISFSNSNFPLGFNFKLFQGEVTTINEKVKNKMTDEFISYYGKNIFLMQKFME